MGKKRTIMVKYLRTERFTNRNVDIKVELYEMDMAIVDITVKPALSATVLQDESPVWLQGAVRLLQARGIV